MTGWILAVALANALDAGSTCVAFKRGLLEGNPLLPSNCPAVVSIKAGHTVGAVWALRPIFKEQPKLAKWLTVITIAVPTYATIHNLRAIRSR